MIGAAVLTIMLFSFRIWVSWGAKSAVQLSRLLGIDRFRFVENILQRIGGRSVTEIGRSQAVDFVTRFIGTRLRIDGRYIRLPTRAVDLQLNPLQVIIGVAVAMVAGAIPVTVSGVWHP